MSEQPDRQEMVLDLTASDNSIEEVSSEVHVLNPTHVNSNQSPAIASAMRKEVPRLSVFTKSPNVQQINEKYNWGGDNDMNVDDGSKDSVKVLFVAKSPGNKKRSVLGLKSEKQRASEAQGKFHDYLIT